MKIVVPEFMNAGAVDRLRQQFDVCFDPTLVDRPADLAAQLAEAEGLFVRNRTQVNAALLAVAPRLRVVGRLGVGLDNIDQPACAARGITVIPAVGANALAVAEYVIATTMLLLRGVFAATAETAAGRWPRTPLSRGRETSGKTLGIIGFGGIGRLTARLAQGLGMRVIASDAAIAENDPVWQETNVASLPLEQLLAEADTVTLHVPLTPETRNLVDARRLSLMRPESVLINTARGGVVDERALAEALRDGKLGGAALDVFDDEPLPAGSPLAALLETGFNRLILTPHIAGLTRESDVRVSYFIAEKGAEALLRTKP
jgi:(S)-sulfolactate dehydrogenase